MVDDVSLASLALVAVAGALSSVINVLAGGGGMIVLPVLMALGLPAGVANGTYRLSVLTQSLAAIQGFRGQGKLPEELILPVLAPTALGAALGAYAATQVPEAVLKPVMLVTMVVMAALIAFRRTTLLAAEAHSLPFGPRAYAALFLASLYGGFIQAGVGFLLLAVFVGSLNLDLVTANALKMICTLVFALISLAIFALAGEVAWLPAAVLAAASIFGAQVGVRLAVKTPPNILRWVVFCCVVATSIGAWARA
jgi:hypothetical protein